MNIHQRILAELSELECRAQLRELQMVHGIDFSSNDYLGLATDPRLKQALAEGVEYSARLASTGSRLLSGHSEAWTHVEQDFAHWVGADAALYFTSGYAANIGLLSAILMPGDIVFSDSANHASLIDGIRLSKCTRVIFPHLDLEFLEKELQSHASAAGARIIVVESIFSMEGDRAPLAALAALADRYGAELIVDEAHAIGVRGPRGSGCVAEAGLSARVLASVHTCGKALASAGAFVCGSQNLRNFLINRARTFIFNTALPPYFASQVAAGIKFAAEANAERARLVQLSAFLRNELRSNGFYIAENDSQIVPVMLGSNHAAIHFADHVRARGFGVRAIRPPTVPEGRARLRISLTAKHSEDILAELVLAMVHARDEFSSPRAVSVSQ
ncbi:MAG TPA: 8-amino-7-oxononanoate synthase [Candidatus Saccharimonadales bacterium]|nr:8-amino-7-oxononanoate synthase [Candidatus Saccharimonadales bacterium]